jgi:NAD(P)-dependent dehydrogenase (short-subunit alcohol dehydrogenase family)
MDKKVAVVTGGTSGIGRAIAVRFAREGLRVAVVGRDEGRGAAVVKDIVSGGGEALFLKTDVADSRAVHSMIQSVMRQYGKVDVMVNCAGTVVVGPAENVSEEDWVRIMDTNVKSIFLCVREVIPSMKQNKYGVIINIGSMNGVQGFLGGMPYCTSKAAVVMMTKIMALDYASWNIRVNCINPGIVETPLFLAQFEGRADADVAKKATLERIPLKRFAKPEEIAELAAYLISDSASYLTGANLEIDGGVTAGRMIGRVVAQTN